VIDRARWDAALGTLPPDRMTEYVETLGRSMETARELADFCAPVFAGEDVDDIPDFYKLSNVLEEMRDYFAAQIGGEDGVGETASGELGGASESTGAPGVTQGAVATRAEALRALSEVGSFFRRTEPHSPISYLIARAVKWGNMPLDQLYLDVVRNDEVLDHLWETLGLERPDDTEED
jgi:hypothetical protein